MKKLKNLLPIRTKKSNKTDGGKVLIIGGGTGLIGAGIISALAATKTGAGYTHLMTDLSKYPWLKFPDFIVHPIKLSELKHKNDFSIGVGPGLGINNRSKKMLQYLLNNNFSKVVLDADALSVMALHHLEPLPSTWILSPHEGELSRLLNVNINLIKNNREKYLKYAVEKFQCTVLLKGHHTLIFNNQLKNIISITAGTPALSKAGTGDVLLGIITALKAQGLNSEEACVVAVNLHGMAAKTWEEEGRDYLSLRPTDLLELLPQVIFNLRNQ